MSAIHVIDLSSHVFDCVICDEHVEQPASLPSYGIARYEDQVVPDSYKGECGGAPVCRRCFWIERGLHAQAPEAFLSFAMIREISQGAS